MSTEGPSGDAHVVGQDPLGQTLWKAKRANSTLTEQPKLRSKSCLLFVRGGWRVPVSAVSILMHVPHACTAHFGQYVRTVIAVGIMTAMTRPEIQKKLAQVRAEETRRTRETGDRKGGYSPIACLT